MQNRDTMWHVIFEFEYKDKVWEKALPFSLVRIAIPSSIFEDSLLLEIFLEQN